MQILLFLLIQAVFIQIKAKHFGIYYRDKKSGCKQQCADKTTYLPEWIDDERNCINYCLSQECYFQIYGSNPMKQGENRKEDIFQFKICLKKEAIEKGLAEDSYEKEKPIKDLKEEREKMKKKIAEKRDLDDKEKDKIEKKKKMQEKTKKKIRELKQRLKDQE